MFEPVKNQRVSDEILQQIREAVLTGKFQIGDRLPNERTLAEQFAASRTSVREALRGLEQQGVIYTKKGVTGGAFVADLDHRLVSRSFQTLLKLRGVGGLTAAPGSQSSARLANVFTSPLGDGEETAHGLWVRQLTVDNPLAGR